MGISDYTETQSRCRGCELLGKQIIGVTPIKSTQSKPGQSNRQLSREQTKTQHELVIKLFVNGSTKKDVAVKTGFAVSTVKNILGGTTAIKDKKAKRDKEILKMAALGISSKSIAKKFGVSLATVKNIRCKKSA